MARNRAAQWRALGAVVRPQARRWLGLGLLLAVSAALVLIGPLLVRRILDRATHHATTAELVRLAVAFLATAVGAHAISLLVTWGTTATAWQTTNQLRLHLAGHVIGLDHEFHRTHTPGELIHRVDGDVGTVGDFLCRALGLAISTLFFVFGVIVILFVLDWRLGLGTAVYVAAIIATLSRVRHRAISEARDEMSATARLYGGIEERLTAAEDLRANGAVRHALSRFVDDSAAVMDTAVRRERAFMALWLRLQAWVGAGAGIALVASSFLVPNGMITLGTAFLLYQYAGIIERPLHDFLHHLELVQKANGAMRRVGELLDEQGTIVDEGTTVAPPGALPVHFDHVGFHYGDEQAVLDDVDLHLAAGTTTGIVGRSGSGKTTLSRLVLRLVEATEGTVRLGGVPIAELPLTELRRRVAYIPQEVELFGASVRDNVTMFEPGFDDAAIAAALTNAGLGDVAGDLDRVIAAGGGGLSAGEAQLISLARVWLREPDLIVLDEATARIDPLTEQRLGDAVRELRRGRTVLIIAHRLKTLADVDQIVVVDAGRIVETGPRDELSRKPGGRYARLLEVGLEEQEELA